MSAFLLSVHVLAAILAIGPVAIATSMFPRYARLVLAASDDPSPHAGARLLHRVTRVYAVIGLLVPVFGIATGASLGALGETWLIVSMLLTAGAAGLLVAFILPGQARVIRALATTPSGAPEPSADRIARRLGMLAGVFNLLWAIVVVLMVYRPGSTTGVGL